MIGEPSAQDGGDIEPATPDEIDSTELEHLPVPDADTNKDSATQDISDLQSTEDIEHEATGGKVGEIAGEPSASEQNDDKPAEAEQDVEPPLDNQALETSAADSKSTLEPPATMDTEETDMPPAEEHVDDRRVSFAPGTPEPKPTQRKKKSAKGTKGKRKRVAVPIDSLPPEVVAMIDGAFEELPPPPPPPPVSAEEDSSEKESVNEDADHDEPSSEPQVETVAISSDVPVETVDAEDAPGDNIANADQPASGNGEEIRQDDTSVDEPHVQDEPVEGDIKKGPDDIEAVQQDEPELEPTAADHEVSEKDTKDAPTDQSDFDFSAIPPATSDPQATEKSSKKKRSKGGKDKSKEKGSKNQIRQPSEPPPIGLGIDGSTPAVPDIDDILMNIPPPPAVENAEISTETPAQEGAGVDACPEEKQSDIGAEAAPLSDEALPAATEDALAAEHGNSLATATDAPGVDSTTEIVNDDEGQSTTAPGDSSEVDQPAESQKPAEPADGGDGDSKEESSCSPADSGGEFGEDGNKDEVEGDKVNESDIVPEENVEKVESLSLADEPGQTPSLEADGEENPDDVEASSEQDTISAGEELSADSTQDQLAEEIIVVEAPTSAEGDQNSSEKNGEDGTPPADQESQEPASSEVPPDGESTGSAEHENNDTSDNSGPPESEDTAPKDALSEEAPVTEEPSDAAAEDAQADDVVADEPSGDAAADDVATTEEATSNEDLAEKTVDETTEKDASPEDATPEQEIQEAAIDEEPPVDEAPLVESTEEVPDEPVPVETKSAEDDIAAPAPDDEAPPEANVDEDPPVDVLSTTETAGPKEEISHGAEPEPVAPPSPNLSKSSSGGSHKHKADHWERKHAANALKEVFEDSRVLQRPHTGNGKFSKDHLRVKDRAPRSRRSSETAEEEEARRRRRAIRKAEEAARLVEEERRMLEEERARRIRREERRAARKARAEADEKAELARKQTEVIAGSEAEGKSRRHRERDRDREHERPQRPQREVKSGFPALTLPPGLSFAKGESVHGVTLVRSYSGGSRQSTQPPTSPIRERKEDTSSKEPDREVSKQETPGPPSSSGTKSDQKHHRRHHRSESDRSKPGRMESDHRPRRLAMEERPRSFFGTLMRGL